MRIEEQNPFDVAFYIPRLKYSNHIGNIRKSIIMMNIQFNRARKLAHSGEEKENIQINFYSKLCDTRSPVSSSVSI